MSFYILKFIVLFAFILALVLPNFFLFAEEDLEKICEIENIEKKELSLSKKDYETLLKECEKYYIEKSKEVEKDITKTESDKNTLNNKISSFKKKIINLNYQINQSNLMIKDLDFQIGDTQLSIDETGTEIENMKQRLADILRIIYEEDQRTLIEVLFSEKNFSDFFDNLISLEILNSENQEVLEDVKSLKFYLENQKISLDSEKDDKEKMLAIYELQGQENVEMKKEQEYFLKLTEKEYQKHIKEKEDFDKSANEIRSRIFELIGVPEAPTFGEAYQITKYVEGITGIRPAFLLAILTQESNIGKNVGQCFLKNPKTGDGIYIKTGEKAPRTMSPSSSVPKFLEITKELGRDPYKTPVSCCMYYKGKPYGWGGAMGPAQFIPSTWVLYKDKISAVTGSPANPWHIKDAFLASGIFLSELGGNNNEFKAAMRYFSGTNWTKYEEFYGRSVIALAEKYQRDISKIQNN